MGKAAKKKKRAQRFDPLARPDAAMQVDDDAETEVPKLSAHKARHLERKRLQAEAKVKRERQLCSSR
jgi:septum formation inhibitor MinC